MRREFGQRQQQMLIKKNHFFDYEPIQVMESPRAELYSRTRLKDELLGLHLMLVATFSVDSSTAFCIRISAIRKDRSSLTSVKKSGGGVMIAVHSDITSSEMCSSVIGIEHIFVSTRMFNREMLIGAAYLPPSLHWVLIPVFVSQLKRFAHR
ncbi:hypothetical protein J6590_093249 [Homalodisca vitripennis]|nr:hypothetical protein J6590_093249 [Homalodisca vitripennis]